MTLLIAQELPCRCPRMPGELRCLHNVAHVLLGLLYELGQLAAPAYGMTKLFKRFIYAIQRAVVVNDLLAEIRESFRQ